MRSKSSLSGLLGTKGFTLIELLVVVLIIGILAAVALPQYQKAVEKSRAMEALQLLKTVNNAVDAYHLASGEWPKTFDELSVDIPWTGREKGYMTSTISDVRSNGKWSIQLEGNNSNGYYAIITTRLDGKYVGAGFFVQKATITDQVLDVYLCNEYLQGNKTFSGEAGSFCVKVIGGTLRKAYGWGREYTLPW